MSVHYGFVKEVWSGDTIVVVGPAQGGPPPEKQITFSSLSAPRCARSEKGKEEPFGWQAREWLREKIAGKQVAFKLDPPSPNARRSYGVVKMNGENINVAAVRAGWCTVRGNTSNTDARPDLAELLEAQAAAEAAGAGVHCKEPGAAERSRRHPVWANFNGMDLLAELKGKKTQAIVEQVRDGSTLKLTLLPRYESVIMYVCGVQAPGFIRTSKEVTIDAPVVTTSQQVLGNEASTSVDDEYDEGDDAAAATKPTVKTVWEEKPTPWSREARYFTEVRLMHRTVDVVLHSVDKYNVFAGEVITPAGDIAEALLSAGLAKFVGWSAAQTSREEAYRVAQGSAQARKVALWKNYVAPAAGTETVGRQFTGKVIEVVSGDTLSILDVATNVEARYSLSSIRAPRLARYRQDDAPYAFEAREYLRNKTVGKKVHCRVDYVREDAVREGSTQPPLTRVYITCTREKTNVAEVLVKQGMATVNKHRRQDEERSLVYDTLLDAEQAAIKARVGIHNSKEPPQHLMNDLTFDPNRPGSKKLDARRAADYVSAMQRSGEVKAIVEHVFQGARFKLTVPSQRCVLSFALSGIRCPRVDLRKREDSEPQGAAAYDLARVTALQHDVVIDVETADRAGTFLGTMFVNKKNLAVVLLENGLAKLSDNADRCLRYEDLQAAEETARQAKRGIWANYKAPTAAELSAAATASSSDRPVETFDCAVSEVASGGHFFVQFAKDKDAISKTQAALKAADLSGAAPAGFSARYGDTVAAKFSQDEQWYRGKVMSRVQPDGRVKVFFIDYGNSELMSTDRLRPLPAGVSAASPAAREAKLAFVRVPEPSADFGGDALSFFGSAVWEAPLVAQVHGRDGNVASVVLYHKDDCDADAPDVRKSMNAALLEAGLALLEPLPRKASDTTKAVHAALLESQDVAKDSRAAMWRYGDVSLDDEDDRRV